MLLCGTRVISRWIALFDPLDPASASAAHDADGGLVAGAQAIPHLESTVPRPRALVQVRAAGRHAHTTRRAARRPPPFSRESGADPTTLVRSERVAWCLLLLLSAACDDARGASPRARARAAHHTRLPFVCC